MMIKVESFLNLVTKIATAVGENDLIKMEFSQPKGKKVCSLVAYDGKYIQFQGAFAYDGDAEADGAYIVKASRLIKLLTLYKELGVEEITIEPAENTIAIKDGKGSSILELTDKMVTLSQKALNEGVKGKFVMPLKDLQEKMRVASISIAKETIAAMNGVYFALDDDANGYTIYSSDSYIGTRNSITADITVPEGGKTEEMSFFAMPPVTKAIAALKGDTVQGIVTGKYLLLKDAENTLAVVALNKSSYPVALMKKTFTKKDEAGDATVYARVTLPVSTFMAATELCTLSSSDKIVKLNFADDKFKLSEANDKSARTIDEAAVALDDPKVLEKYYTCDICRKTLKAINTDKVTVKFTSQFELLYADGADYPVALMLPRKKA